MKKVLLVLGILLVCAIMVIIGGLLYYKNQIGPVSDSDEKIVFTVSDGDNYYSISKSLKEKGLIKSEEIYKIYLKLNTPNENLKVGEYYLSPNMDLKMIINTLNGKSISRDIVITFKEGKNMRNIASTIAQNTNNTEEDVYSVLTDESYLRELINEYWFIDESILNKNIYYSLEGYLYPNTYNFRDKDVTVKEIFKVMLDETAKQIEPYKSSIINSKYSFHELLTMASILELEASSNDRKNVAGVFYNRLKANMSLGSDVTTYYAAKVEMSERDLYAEELNAVNAYNTRGNGLLGKLPVGPICNPSISSIDAAINPTVSGYYFFLADKDGNIYYSVTNAEHEKKMQELKSVGKWYEY